MVHVATASGTFHAHVIRARLGAAGILSETQGGSEGPYPFAGCVEVYVPEDEAEAAAAILQADAEAEADTADTAATAEAAEAAGDGTAWPG